MWVFAGDVFGSGADLDFGRLDFEDDRLWWWDTELDAVRLEWDGGPGDALAQCSQRGGSSAPCDPIRANCPPKKRIICACSPSCRGSWRRITASSCSYSTTTIAPTAPPPWRQTCARAGSTNPTRTCSGWGRARSVRSNRHRNGSSATGPTAARPRARAIVEHGEPEAGLRPVEAVIRHDVSGWAFDLGLTAVAPAAFEPRATIGYAIGSGDEGDGKRDRSYRQSGLHANETGLGGVRRFTYYGRLLDPELSNLAIATAGAGLAVLGQLARPRLPLLPPDPSRRVAARRSNSKRRSTVATATSATALDLVLAIEEGEPVRVRALRLAVPRRQRIRCAARRVGVRRLAAVRIAF